MAGTVYPNGIDNNSTLPQVVDLVTPVKAEVVNNLRNAILAIESELGIDPSREYGTVRARLDALSAVISTTRGGISEVKQEGTTVVAPVTKLNFTGNVVVTDAGDCQADVQILSQALSVIQETINPIINGQTQFTLSCSPSQDNTVQMFINGVKQQYGVDYTVTGKVATYLGSHSTKTTDDIEFYYIASGGVGHQETKAVTVNGQVDFYLNATPLSASVVQMFVNGAKQQYSIDYDGVTVHMVYLGPLTLKTTDVIEFWYISAAGADCISGDVNDASNVGTGEDVFRDKISGILYFKRVNVVNGLTISTIADSVVIDGYGLLQRDGQYPMIGDLDMGGHDIINVGNLGYAAHAYKHINGGADEIDGYQLNINYTPSNYLVVTDTLGSNLEGIDIKLGSVIDSDGSVSMTGDFNLDGNSLTNVDLINGIDYEAHAVRHQNGGADEVNVTGLSGVLIEAQRLGIRKSGTLVGTRPNLNLIPGANISLFMTDSPVNDRVDVTITSTGGGGGGGVDPHALTHIFGASDQISGDNLYIGWYPLHYTPDTTPLEVSDTSELTAHLAGIDDYIGNLTKDHGLLTGLTDDDHTQYLLVSGTRAMTGDLNMGGQDINAAKDGYFTGNGYFGGKLTVKGIIDPTALVLDEQTVTPVGAFGTTKGVLWAKSAGRGVATTPYFTDSDNIEHLLAYDGYVVRDHGGLTGLTDDDHAQYLLVNGTRAMTGGLNMATFNITNCGTINSVSITAHGTRHNPGGTDAATTGVPSTTAVIVGNSVLEGSALSFARSDHIHAVTAGTPVSIGTTNTAGNATTFAASNHIHDHGALLGGDRHAAVTTSINGFMTAADKTKLDSVTAGAQPNTYAFANFTDGTNTAVADGYADTFKFRTANNILGLLVTNDDVTHGDNILYTINQANIDHGSIAGLTDDDHTNYVHISTARTITARHTFNPGSASSPFILGANATGQLVTGLNSDLLDGYHYTDFLLPTRTINTTAPLTGGGSLASNLTLAVSNATTGAVGVIKLAQDLGGTGLLPEVLKIRGTTVSTAGGALTTGHVLKVSGASAVDYGYITDANIATNAITFDKLENTVTVSVLLPPTIGDAVEAFRLTHAASNWAYVVDFRAVAVAGADTISKTFTFCNDYGNATQTNGILIPNYKSATDSNNSWDLSFYTPGAGSNVVCVRRLLGSTATRVTIHAYCLDGYASFDTMYTGNLVLASYGLLASTNYNNFITANGASIPIAGALTTNHMLKVSGASTLDYGYVVNANVSATAAIAVSKLATSTHDYVLKTNSTATTVEQGLIANANIATLAGIEVSKLDPGTLNYVVVSNGTTTIWSMISDINITANSVSVSKLAPSSADFVVKTNSSGTAVTQGLLLNANIDVTAAIAVSKLANGATGQFLMTSGATPTWVTRSVSTTAPLTGGGSLASDLTLDVSDATTGAVGVIKLAQDLGGTALLPDVLKIHGATVPAAGALTTNHVLKVSGASALGYGYIVNANIDSAADIVVTKLAPSSPHYVVKTNTGGTAVEQGLITDNNISGSASITVTKIAAGAVNTLLWTNASSIVGWSGTPTISTLSLSSGVLTFGADASTTGSIRFGNANSIRWRNATNDGNIVGLYVDSNNDVVLGDTLTTSRVVLRSGTSAIYLDGATVFDGSLSLNSIGTVAFSSTTLTPAINQSTITTAAGQDMAISAQSSSWANAAATGGDMYITSGAGGSGSTDGNLHLRTGGNTKLSLFQTNCTIDYSAGGGGKVILRDLSGSTSHGAVYLGISSPSASNYSLESNGTTTVINAATTVRSAIANVAKFEVNTSAISTYVASFYNELLTSAWTIQHQSTNSGNGNTTNIKAQSSTDVTSTGGALSLYSGAGTSTDGNIFFYNGTTQVVSVSSGSNLRFVNTVVNPQIYQSASTVVGASGQPLKISSQSNTTTGGTGGDLTLTSGTGQTDAADGDLYLETGDNTRVKVSNLLTTFYPAGTSRVVFTDTEATFSFYSTSGADVVIKSYSSTVGSIYFGGVTPSSTNYTLAANGSNATYLNAESGGIYLRINNANRLTLTDATLTVAPSGTTRLTLNATAATFSYGANNGKVALREWVSDDTYGAVYLGNVTPSATNYALISNSTLLSVNAIGSVSLSLSNVPKLTVSSTQVLSEVRYLTFNDNTNDVLITHTAATGGAGKNFKIKGQTTAGAGAAGGSVVIESGTGGAGGVNGWVQLIGSEIQFRAAEGAYLADEFGEVSRIVSRFNALSITNQTTGVQLAGYASGGYISFKADGVSATVQLTIASTAVSTTVDVVVPSIRANAVVGVYGTAYETIPATFRCGIFGVTGKLVAANSTGLRRTLLPTNTSTATTTDIKQVVTTSAGGASTLTVDFGSAINGNTWTNMVATIHVTHACVRGSDSDHNGSESTVIVSRASGNITLVADYYIDETLTPEAHFKTVTATVSGTTLTLTATNPSGGSGNYTHLIEANITIVGTGA